MSNSSDSDLIDTLIERAEKRLSEHNPSFDRVSDAIETALRATDSAKKLHNHDFYRMLDHVKFIAVQLHVAAEILDQHRTSQRWALNLRIETLKGLKAKEA